MSEQTAEGKIFRISEKKWNDKTFYSFKFDGQDGWYRLGDHRTDDKVQEGWTVRVGYEIDARGNRNVVPGHVKLVEKGDPIPAKGKGGQGGGGGGYAPRSAKTDETIQYQAAGNRSQEHVRLLLEWEAIKLPAKTKAEERRAVIDGMVDFYHAKFFLDIAGRAAVERSNDELAVSTEIPSEPAQDETEAPEWGDDNGGDANEWD
jgi:hypothetical protein